MESQRYGHLNKAGTMTTAADVPTWTREIPHGLTPSCRSTGCQSLLRQGELVSSWDELPHRLYNP